MPMGDVPSPALKAWWTVRARLRRTGPCRRQDNARGRTAGGAESPRACPMEPGRKKWLRRGRRGTEHTGALPRCLASMTPPGQQISTTLRLSTLTAAPAPRPISQAGVQRCPSPAGPIHERRVRYPCAAPGAAVTACGRQSPHAAWHGRAAPGCCGRSPRAHAGGRAPGSRPRPARRRCSPRAGRRCAGR